MTAEEEKETVALDTKQSVVLGNTFATRGSTSLDLTNTESDDEVGNDSVLRLTTSVRDHDAPTVRLGELSATPESVRKSQRALKRRTLGWIQRWYQFGLPWV